MLFGLYWGAVIIAVPVFIKVQNFAVDARISKDFFFLMCSFISLSLFGTKNTIKWIRPVLVFVLLSAFLNQFNMISFNTFYQWICISVGICLIPHFSGNINDKNLTIIINAISVSCIFQVIWLLLNYVNYDPYTFIVGKIYGTGFIKHKVTHTGIRPESINELQGMVGMLGNPNVSGALLAISSASLLRGRWIYLYPICFFAIYETNSMFSIASAFIGLLVYLWITLKIKYKSIIFSVILSVGAYISTLIIDHQEILNGNGRFLAWGKVFEWMQPGVRFFGLGPGFFPDFFWRFHIVKLMGRNLRWLQAHNEYLETYIIFGYIGLAILIYMLIIALKQNRNTLAYVGLITVMANSLGHFTLHVSSTALLAIIYYSILIKEETHGITKKKNNEGQKRRYLSRLVGSTWIN